MIEQLHDNLNTNMEAFIFELNQVKGRLDRLEANNKDTGKWKQLVDVELNDIRNKIED